MERNEKSICGNDSTRPWQSYHTVYTNAKAGMEGVDKEKVQRIVYEMSKGSKYFENEEKKEALMKHKIDNMQAQRANLSAADIARYQKIADKRIIDLETTRDLSRIWLHVDMDAFYAAVETLCNPSLKGKPMAVGGLSMISTANYEARKFGVRAAMPGFIARKLCPELIFVPIDFKKYNYYSDLTRQVCQKYDPNFLAASLDEAYLDITNICTDRGMTGGEVAEELRENVHKETGLTCSAGVAPNRLLAKVCSDINKPNGQFVLPNERMAVVTFISSLPIRKIGGIGKVTESILREVFGISTCDDMLQKSSFICALFSHSSADFFLSVGLGLGRTDVPQVTLRKSMSYERTFSATADEAFIHQKLEDLAENLSSDMKKEGLCGKTLTLKLKTSSFEVRTRAVTMPNYICSSEDILKHAKKLLKAELPASLRLMGLRMSHFSEGGKSVTIDPKQKTLSNFIVTGDASGKTLGERELDITLFFDLENNFPTDTQWTSEPFDLADAQRIPNIDHTESRHGNSKPEAEGDLDLHIVDATVVQVYDHDSERDAKNLFPTTAEQLVKKDSSPVRPKRVNSYTNSEPGSSFDTRQPAFWLEDYRCSICGIEMLPSFVEERREHFDFHFAERLQEEEKSSNFERNLKPMQKLIQKDQMSHSRQKKKMKASPSVGKHIPIDLFFAKKTCNS